MTNILEKLNKPLLLAILGPFCPFSGKNMFLQNWTLPVFRFSNYLTSFKKKKLMNGYRGKLQTHRHRDGQKKQSFQRALCLQVSNKMVSKKPLFTINLFKTTLTTNIT